MADHTAPDYYEQVVRESEAQIEADNAKIEAKVEELVEHHFEEIKGVLGYEFGWATVRHADMGRVKAYLRMLAEEAAEAGKGVMIESHYQQSKGNGAAMLRAVFVGMELATDKKE